ncbi:hypothetical protein DWV63_02960 [Enterococcus durans]|nr:hypothetical protein CJZ72_06535 [Enterococcus durans]RGW68099.1 hypothetical protein DWV63_02960 [Enterococcus durans]
MCQFPPSYSVQSHPNTEKSKAQNICIKVVKRLFSSADNKNGFFETALHVLKNPDLFQGVGL